MGAVSDHRTAMWCGDVSRWHTAWHGGRDSLSHSWHGGREEVSQSWRWGREKEAHGVPVDLVFRRVGPDSNARDVLGENVEDVFGVGENRVRFEPRLVPAKVNGQKVLTSACSMRL